MDSSSLIFDDQASHFQQERQSIKLTGQVSNVRVIDKKTNQLIQ
jgi:hypothetical protein